MKKKIAFLVTHGTDTMAWGVNYLSYALKNMAFNVAVVGSQIPLEDTPNGSDGYLNLESAVFALSTLVPPHIFVPMNSGKMIFNNDVWKVDKWDTMAFDGNVIIRKNSNHIIYDQGITIKEKSTIDKLYIVKTGGTLELTMDQGVLKPDKEKDSVSRFLKARFGEKEKEKSIHISEIESYSLMAKDSSNMIPDDWKEITDFIVKKARENGYHPYRGEGIAENVPVIFSTPLTTAGEFDAFSKDKPGIVFIGYGGGNINITPDSSHSPLQFFRNCRKQGRFIVLHSHPARGILDPIYETGRVVFDEKLAIPAMDFSIARCQIKLSYILGNIEKVKEFLKRRKMGGENLERIVALLFLSGAVFPRPETKDYFESLWQIQIPENDLLFDYTIEDALAMTGKYLGSRGKRSYTLEEFVNKKTNVVLVLKPDDIVGENKSGAEINAAENISAVITDSFEWDVVTVPLKKGISFDENVKRLLSSCKIIFSEGGRQSVYDEKSFQKIEDYATRDEMLIMFKNLIKQRSSSVNTPPGIYICLSHQLIAETIKELVDDIIESKDQFSLLEKWESLKKELKEMKAKIVKERDSIVKKNEKPEMTIVDLKRYQFSVGVPGDLEQSHREISGKYSGLIEDFIGFEKVDIAMLHGDEVDEQGVLYLNWALAKLNEFRTQNKQDIPGDSILWQIPVGLEITSSTYDGEGNVLTEVASMAIYYIDREGFFYRDFSFQFHPELILSGEIRQIYSGKEIRPSFSNDGLKVLLSTIVSSFERFKLS